MVGSYENQLLLFSLINIVIVTAIQIFIFKFLKKNYTDRNQRNPIIS